MVRGFFVVCFVGVFFAFTKICQLNKKQTSRRADTGFYLQNREHIFHMDVMDTSVIINNRHNRFPTILEDHKYRTVIKKISKATVFAFQYYLSFFLRESYSLLMIFDPLSNLSVSICILLMLGFQVIFYEIYNARSLLDLLENICT